MQATEKVKYLIIGQGLVGTWMSYHIEKAGHSFKVINDPSMPTATSVASGVMNPVTGRRIVQTWMIETILPYAVKQYQAIGEKLNIQIIQKAPVILIHPSQQMKDSFEYRMEHENIYLFKQDPSKWTPYFKTPFGTGAIDECYWMDLNKMTSHWQQYLQLSDKYIAAQFDVNEIKFTANTVIWKNLEAEIIIFCDGIHSMHNPYFKALPFAPNKGEALIIKVPGLSNNHIYKNNVSVVPWKDDLFWVGSSYEWKFTNLNPSESFKEKMIQNLNEFMELPYTVVDHITGIRPANTERRPFVGAHPVYPQLAICNGMGTKGCSLSPYFTMQLLNHIEHAATIEPEASLTRFESILSEIK